MTPSMPEGHSAPDSSLWTEPTRRAAAWHAAKRWGHVAVRTARNLARGPRRIHPSRDMADAPVVAEHQSPLWVDGRPDEFALRCGKVQNLRMAVRAVDGIVVAPGQTLSFWAQVGRPSARRGFAIGREIVSGCVVPTDGGGLCQLSNALASVGTAIGARFVERHRHSARIEAQAAPDEDATIAWNHIDLRLAADVAIRIEAELTRDELVVRLRAWFAPALAPAALVSSAGRGEARPVARGCLTCDQTTCFRHRPRALPSAGRTAVLLGGDPGPEETNWLSVLGADADWMRPWQRPGGRGLPWSVPPQASVKTAYGPTLRRVVRQRLRHGDGAARQANRLRTPADLARTYARSLRPEHTRLLLTQDLLVPLWRLGVLGGRAFDVFVRELPASELQARLDMAAAARPDLADLHDFRVDPGWQQDEWAALARAQTLVTAHQEVYRCLVAAGLTAERLPWHEPPSAPRMTPIDGRPLTLTLASSALPRKGAADVAAVARALGAEVQILGSSPGEAALWEGVRWASVGYDGDWLARSDVVVLPAHVEHQPRALLHALAAGVPVVASPACGLGLRPGLTEVEPGDVDALLAAVRASVPRGRRVVT